MGFRNLDFIDVELESPDSLIDKDIIYINGGNPFYLLHHMKKSRSSQIIRQIAMKNTVIEGVSAGAVILGPYIKLVHYFTPQLNFVQMNDFSALNLTEKIVFPHYDREDLFRDSTN